MKVDTRKKLSIRLTFTDFEKSALCASHNDILNILDDEIREVTDHNENLRTFFSTVYEGDVLAFIHDLAFIPSTVERYLEDFIEKRGKEIAF